MSTALASPQHLSGLAAMGKVALALLVIIAVIFLCAWLLRRIGSGGAAAGNRLRIVGARAVGHKERVVLMDIEGTRLVLGVAPGRISKLHVYPCPDDEANLPDGEALAGPFAERFARALRQNLNKGR